MRVERVRLHNVGSYLDVDINLAELPGPLLALIGKNGAGKSGFAELGILGALYRDTENQGSLKDRATAKDACIETTIVNGTRMTFRQKLGTAELLDEAGGPLRKRDGTPVLPNAGVTEFRDWAKLHLPSRDVLQASLFSAQKSAGFLGLGDSDRMDVILEAVGCSHYERMAKLAREHARAVDKELGGLRLRIEAEAERADQLDLAKANLLDDQQDLESARVAVELARAALADGNAKAQEFERLQDAYIWAVGERERKTAELREAKSKLADIDERIEGNRGLLADGDKIRAAVTQATELRAAIAQHQADAGRLRAEAEGLEREAAGLSAQATQAQGAARAAEQRAEVARGRLAKKHEVEAAISVLPVFRSQLSEAVLAADEAERVRVELEGRARAAAALEAQASADERRALDAGKRADQQQAVLARKASVDAAVAALPGLQDRADELRLELKAAEAELERLRGQRVAGAEERIGGLRSGLQEIVDMSFASDISEAIVQAGSALGADDQAIKLASELPAATKTAERTITALRSAQAIAEGDVLKAQRIADQADAMGAAERALAAAQTEVREAAEAAQAVRAKLIEQDVQSELAAAALVLASARSDVARHRQEVEASERLAALAPTLEGAKADLDAALAEDQTERQKAESLHKKAADKRIVAAARQSTAQWSQDSVATTNVLLQELAPLLADVELLAVAQTKIDGYEREAAPLRDTIATLTQELTDRPAPAHPPPAPDLSALRHAVADTEERFSTETANVARSELAVEQCQKAAEKLQELEAQRSRAADDLSDWNRLGEDLGRGGLQAEEISCAGPQLTVDVNELLSSCYGPRFTLRIDTQKWDAKKTRLLEQCGVTVLDSRDDSEREARLFSGGETAVLQEAMALALTVLSCRTAGLQNVTLIRDETTGQLDPEHALAYIRMMNKAVEMVGADKCIYVAHQRELQEAADSALLFKYDEVRRCTTIEVAA